ncbi:MAG: hypothetical protein EBX52_10370 [Proteobacteria bacterium]|nr:hypothetical protein [Pseudomonadota bacterium]
MRIRLQKAFLATFLIGFWAGGDAQALSGISKSAGQELRNLPSVKKSGTLYLQLSGNPRVMIPCLANDLPSRSVSYFLFAQLMMRDGETGDFYPYLAEKVEVSKDKKDMTFTLRKDATWDDGTPVTVDDVEFTYQKIMDPKVEAAPVRSYIETLKFTRIDERTFRFHADQPNVNTLSETIEDFHVIQKKQFAGAPDFNKAKGVMEPVGSGPYRLKAFSRDQKLEFELKKDWWGFKIPEFKNQYNFENLVFRIIPDRALAYEKFLKGEIDLYEMTAEIFGTKARGVDKEKVGADAGTDKAVWAKHFVNDAPATFSYVGWNLKRPVFRSKKTRQALAHLINYDEIIEKVYYGEGVRCISPFGSRTRNSAPDQKAKAFRFDPKKGLAMLKEDGWSDADGTNVISKEIDGKRVRFEFTIRYNSDNPMRAKIAQMVKEQFKKAGIVVNVQAIEFNTLITSIEGHDFDAVVMAWARGPLHPDSKQIWHSKSADNKGSNYVSYSNPEADKLIEQATAELDPEKHIRLNQKIGAIIYDDQPYAFLAEVPGFIYGFKRDKLKAKKWVHRYDDLLPVSVYSPL